MDNEDKIREIEDFALEVKKGLEEDPEKAARCLSLAKQFKDEIHKYSDKISAMLEVATEQNNIPAPMLIYHMYKLSEMWLQRAEYINPEEYRQCIEIIQGTYDDGIWENFFKSPEEIKKLIEDEKAKESKDSENQSEKAE